jgi:hypothetical protein
LPARIYAPCSFACASIKPAAKQPAARIVQRGTFVQVECTLFFVRSFQLHDDSCGRNVRKASSSSHRRSRRCRNTGAVIVVRESPAVERNTQLFETQVFDVWLNAVEDLLS